MTTVAIAGPSDAARRPRAFTRLYHGQTRFDFVRRRRWWFAGSAIVIMAGLVSLGVRGLNYSIEFVGGTSWEVAAPGVTVAQAQAALTPLGFGGATITVLGSGSKQSLNVEAKLSGKSAGVSTTEAAKVASVLAALVHKPASSVSVETVGPTWGSDITHKAVEALIVFLIVITAYISLFFEWKMAIAALVAVAHDIVITVGIYSLTGLEVTPDTVVAFLTILGYSLYDTIVVFDRVRDNLRHLSIRDRLTLTDTVNLSMNQTLARSINTSLVAIMPILAVLVLGAQILGATTLQYFGLALLVGLTTGAYSSIFIASPLVGMLKEREQRYRIVRERLESRGNEVWLLSPAELAAGQFAEASATNQRFSARARARQQRLTPGAAAASNGETAEAAVSERRSASGTGPSPRAGARPPQRPRKPAARAKRRGGRR